MQEWKQQNSISSRSGHYERSFVEGKGKDNALIEAYGDSFERS
jgi:hypothetical protein